MESTIALLIPIIISLGAFAMIIGIKHYDNKENMGMIEKGINPRTDKPSKSRKSLREGYLFVGAGFGLLLAKILAEFVFTDSKTMILYFALAFLFGGIGLILAHNKVTEEDRANQNSNS